ncbi:MAG TPA: MFS transporter [Candidatus Baltobacteraceae bacterium]|nr:MFS transporter [Candidatus Baltobacteraceae bacterium]
MPPLRPKPSLLGAFWFGIQVVWGALLGVSLQARATEISGPHALAAYGILASSGAAIAAVTQIAVGRWADLRRLHGSRRIEFYAAGALLACPALFWFYAAPNFSALLASLLILQFAMNVAIGPYQAVIPDFIPENQVGTASSWMAALQSLGNACGAVLAALVADARIVAGAIAGTLLASCAITAAHVKNLEPENARVEPLRISRAFVDLFISRALVFLGFYTLLGYLFFYVRGSLGGDTKLLTGAIVLAVTASGAIGAAAAARPADRGDRRGIACAGGAAFVAAIGCFLLSHSLLPIFCSAIFAGAAWGVFLSGDWALGCRFLPRFALATAMGIWNLALLFPQILAPLLANAVLARMHALQSPRAADIAFGLAAIEVLGGILWIWRLPAAEVRSVEKAPSGNIP